VGSKTLGLVSQKVEDRAEAVRERADRTASVVGLVASGIREWTGDHVVKAREADSAAAEVVLIDSHLQSIDRSHGAEVGAAVVDGMLYWRVPLGQSAEVGPRWALGNRAVAVVAEVFWGCWRNWVVAVISGFHVDCLSGFLQGYQDGLTAQRQAQVMAMCLSHRSLLHRMHCHRKDFLPSRCTLAAHTVAEAVVVGTSHPAEVHQDSEVSLVVHVVALRGDGSSLAAGAAVDQVRAACRNLECHEALLVHIAGNSSSPMSSKGVQTNVWGQ
jgi:hypothetical protein